MIYGCVTNNNDKSFSKSLKDLEELMGWPEAKHHKIEYGNFSGGFFFDPRLPYRFDDFCFQNFTEDHIVLLSGIIYNRIEVIENLSIDKSQICDPEIISIAYCKWGNEFANKLNGDFAIFIHKKHSNTSLLFRDHMGVRPLAISHNDNKFWFSSDNMSLSISLYKNEVINPKFIANLLIKHGLPGNPLLSDTTLLPNNKVQKVNPGHYIIYSSLKFVENKYWIPEKIRKDKKIDFPSAIQKIKLMVEDSVKIRCDKRFVSSAHLSGGLDSSLVASLVRKQYKSQLEFNGFSWTPDNPMTRHIDYDERELINNLGYFASIKPVFINIDTQERISLLSEWRSIIDPFQESKVREIANSKKINLIFSGWGGDEFLSMEDIGVDSDLLFNFHLKTFFKVNPLNKPKKFIGTLIYNIILPALSLRFSSLQKNLKFYSKYLQPAFNMKVRTINGLYHWHSRRDMHLRYLYNYHIPERTEDWGILGSRSGVEYRYPLIDKRIIELMLQIPSKLIINEKYSRFIIRNISKGFVTEEIRWNISKIDPVRQVVISDLENSVCIKLMDEVEDFKKNLDLSFINFELLLADIDSYKKGLITSGAYESFGILIFLKKIHELVKMYSKKTNVYISD